MVRIIMEKTVSFMVGVHDCKDKKDKPEVQIYVSGFEPTYSPVTCVRGNPATMTELMQKLSEFLNVTVSAAKIKQEV